MSTPSISDEEYGELYDKYSTLMRAFKTYFPTEDNPTDRSSEFVNSYRRVGERNVEFEGILEQVKQGMKKPYEFAKVFNRTMGYEFSPEQCHEHLVGLHENLTNYDPERVKAKENTDALLGYYLRRSVRIPYFNRDIPLVILFVGGIATGLLGWLGYTYITIPVINQILFAVLCLGLLVSFACALVMYWLRDEVVNADKYEEREEALRASIKDRGTRRRRFLPFGK